MSTSPTVARSTPQFVIKGVVDDCTECGCCGRTNLKRTVALMPLDQDGNEDGAVCYYGTSCAAAALRWTQTQVTNAANLATSRNTERGNRARRIISVFGPLQYATHWEQARVWLVRNPHSLRNISAEVDELLTGAQAQLRDTALGPARPHTVADFLPHWVLWDGAKVRRVIAVLPDQDAAREELRAAQKDLRSRRVLTRVFTVQALDELSAEEVAYTTAAVARWEADNASEGWIAGR
ncbi:hypothetical protein ABT127_39130 [Streptomyces sp. NPDC001904]|uniref:hypothetical protein n=1 Tax=Streptomyces sp. NPDC001904 TaxID=3154531 RepID=UPI00332D11C4